MATHYRTCSLCEAMCGLKIETQGERVTSIRGDDDDPFSHGYICPKGPALAALHEDPDRLRHPLIRRDGKLERASWDEAIRVAAEGIHRVQKQHGRDAVAIYAGNPTIHAPGSSIFVPMLMRALRTKNRYSATSVDQLPHHLVAHWMFGHQFLLPVPDVDRTDLFFVMGANPLASNGSLMSAPGMRTRIKAIQERGGRVVVFDPRRTETAEIADEHVAVRPGTDAWLLAAMTRNAIREGRGLGRLTEHAERLDVLTRAMGPFTPERASQMCGVPTSTIERLAREFVRAERAVVYGRMGLSTQRFGALCQWLVVALNLTSGNLDRPGGAMFTSPAVDVLKPPFGVGKGSYARWRSRVRSLPEHGGELPVATLADEMLTPGEGQIRALVTHAGNPVLSTPNGSRLDGAIAKLEHVVCIDFYLNETTRHAHVILPPPSPLERPHYDLAFNALAVRNTAKWSDALFDPGPDAKQDWQILLALIDEIETRRGETGLRKRVQSAALARLGPEGIVNLALRSGRYGARVWPPRGGLSVDKLRKAPHGVDLGALRPVFPEALRAWRTRIDLAPQPLVDDLERLQRQDTGAPLVLIGRRHLRSNNSWMHNVPKLMAGKTICTLLVHPDDARSHGVSHGGRAEVSSRAGKVEVEVEVSDEIMAGVVSLPHGFGHAREGTRLSVANQHAGASVNDLTDELLLDDLAGTAALSGVPVELRPI